MRHSKRRRVLEAVIASEAILKWAEHHQRVHKSKMRVMKRERQAANGFKAEGFPKRYGACVGADDEVELHSAIAALSRIIEGVLTHRTSYAATRCSSTCHVPAVADVLAATRLIGANVVGAHDLAIVLSYERLPVVAQPIRERVTFGHFAIQRVCLACTDSWADDAPDR